MAREFSGSCGLRQNLASPPETASAAVLTGDYSDPYTVKRVCVSQPGPQEVLVQLAFTGVCHGDVYARDGGGPAPKIPIRPLVGGHEGVGTIVAMGTAGMDGFRIGDVVGIAWRSYVCGTCNACKHGEENHCYNQQVTGSHRDGTFQGYVSFPTSQLIPIPAKISLPSVCPILCAGVTVHTSLRLMKPQPSKWCAIVGAAGGLGHLGIQYAKAMDLKVLAIDGNGAEKEAFCKKMGADAFVDFGREDFVEAVVTQTSGGADYILVLSPHQSSYDAAGQYANFGAHIMAVGIGNAHMSLRPILNKNLVVRSNETGTKADILLALDLCVQGKVVPELEIIELDDINIALDRIKSGKVMGKLVVDLQGRKN
ncbi:hypothetical protein CLAIMM_10227 [Cladophialophora immunda]|nr:hypothetical protein CLAIMM_10227 [Cladophialophora immunda]